MFCPSKIGDASLQIHDNLNTVLQSLTLTGADADLVKDVSKQTSDAAHIALAGQLPTLLQAAGINSETLQPLLNFLNSPVSGILVGMLGPFLSPGVALLNSIESIAGDLGTDPSAALQDLIAAPANVVGAFFNGATLDLDGLKPLLNTPGLLPLGVTVQHLDFGLGGLFTAGSVENGPWEIYDSGGGVIAVTPAVGGSMGNSIGIVLAGPSPMDVTNQPVGPLAAWQSLSELIGLELGSNWNGKVGFNHIPAFPPGVGIPPRTIPDLPTSDAGDVGAGAGAAGGLDFGDLVNEFHDFFSDLF